MIIFNRTSASLTRQQSLEYSCLLVALTEPGPSLILRYHPKMKHALVLNIALHHFTQVM